VGEPGRVDPEHAELESAHRHAFCHVRLRAGYLQFEELPVKRGEGLEPSEGELAALRLAEEAVRLLAGRQVDLQEPGDGAPVEVVVPRHDERPADRHVRSSQQALEQLLAGRVLLGLPRVGHVPGAEDHVRTAVAERPPVLERGDETPEDDLGRVREPPVLRPGPAQVEVRDVEPAERPVAFGSRHGSPPLRCASRSTVVRSDKIRQAGDRNGLAKPSSSVVSFMLGSGSIRTELGDELVIPRLALLGVLVLLSASTAAEAPVGPSELRAHASEIRSRWTACHEGIRQELAAWRSSHGETRPESVAVLVDLVGRFVPGGSSVPEGPVPSRERPEEVDRAKLGS
jgi:hypothetical protein